VLHACSWVLHASTACAEPTCARNQTPLTHPHTTPGTLLVALVREFLEWAGLEFTVKVFEPEAGPAAEYHGRMGLATQLVRG